MPEDLTLDEVAEALGVHYMTAYKYVRTGRLPAHRRAGRWHVSALDVAAWQAVDHDAEHPENKPSHSRRDWVDELVGTVVGGSESAAWTICTSALASSHTPESLYLDVLAPTMRRVGDNWADGTLTVAQEHRASAVMTRLVGRLGPQFVRPGRPKGHVILGCPSGDTHALASALLADPLRGRGLDVVDLGADTPVDSFLEALGRAEGMHPSEPGRDPNSSREASSPVGPRRRKSARPGVSVGVVVTSPIGQQTALDMMARVRADARGTVVLGGLQVEGLSADARSDPRLVGVMLSTTYRQALDLLSSRVAQPAG